MPANSIVAGVLIKIGTILIMCGTVKVYTGNDAIIYSGYNVLSASKNRKQAFHALSDTCLTMILPSQAKTISEAESDFTDETEALISNYNKNHIIITGE